MSRVCPGYYGLVHGTDNAVRFQISLRLVDERGGGGYTNYYLLSAEPLNRMIQPARSARHTSSSVRSIRFIPDKTLLLSESGIGRYGRMGGDGIRSTQTMLYSGLVRDKTLRMLI